MNNYGNAKAESFISLDTNSKIHIQGNPWISYDVLITLEAKNGDLNRLCMDKITLMKLEDASHQFITERKLR